MPNYGKLLSEGVNFSHDTAESVSYDNNYSGLSTTNVQNSIDKVWKYIKDIGVVWIEYEDLERGTAATETIELSDTANDIIAYDSYLVLAMFTNGAGYSSAKRVNVFMYRFGGHAPLCINRTNPQLGVIRFSLAAKPSGVGYSTITFNKWNFTDQEPYLYKLCLAPIKFPALTTGTKTINTTVYGKLLSEGVNFSHDTAESLSYNNISSKLTSTNVQDAMDEVITSGAKIGVPIVIWDSSKTTSKEGKVANEYIPISSTVKTLLENGITGYSTLLVPIFSTVKVGTNATVYRIVMYGHGGHYYMRGSVIDSTPTFIRISLTEDHENIFFQQYGPFTGNYYLQKLTIIPVQVY